MTITIELSKELERHFAGDPDMVDVLRAIKWCRAAVSELECAGARELRDALSNVADTIGHDMVTGERAYRRAHHPAPRTW